tara:strand:+ start:4648 stop:5697 length:1050 start_codon:yes stop_codon:yes gene_type:complete
MPEILQGTYPKHHLWGIDALVSKAYRTEIVPTFGNHPLIKIGEWLNKATRGKFGDIQAEISILCRLRKANLLYVAAGHLFFIPLLRRLRFIRMKIITWVFRAPPSSPFWKLSNLHLSSTIVRGFDGILCLTTRAEKQFKKLAPTSHVQFIPWAVDTSLFHPLPDSSKTEPFFLCVGKTGRDYKTFIDAASQSEYQFRIIAPREVASDRIISPNLTFIECSDDPPDTAITYDELRLWYNQATAICIPLNGDPEDTCGYTNLLETMAMGKPILMTKSGCLDIDIESLGIGFWVKAHSIDDWLRKFTLICRNPKQSREMGKRAITLVRSTYNLERFNRDIEKFTYNIIEGMK